MSEQQQKKKSVYTFRPNELLDPLMKESKDSLFLWPRQKAEPDEKLLALAHLTYEGENEKIAEWMHRYQTYCVIYQLKLSV